MTIPIPIISSTSRCIIRRILMACDGRQIIPPSILNIQAAYGGNLRGFSWSLDDSFLCVGDNGIYFFGVYGFGDFTYLTPNN